MEEMNRSKRVVYEKEETPPAGVPKRLKIERKIVSFLINYPEMIDGFKKEIKESDFTHMNKFLLKIYEFFDRKDGISIAKFISLFSEKDDAEFIESITRDALEGREETADKKKLQARKKEAAGLIAEFKNIAGKEEFKRLQKICDENPSKENIAKFNKVMKYSGQRGGYA